MIIRSVNKSSTFQPTFPANTLIIADAGKYAYKNTTNEFATHFKAKATDPDSIAFTNGLGKISFYTPQKQSFGELNSKNTPLSTGSILTYLEIFPKVDLRYTISSTRLLEEFIIKDKATANKVTRIEQIAKTDLKYEEKDNGSIVFKQNEKTSFSLPPPVLYELGNKDNRSEGIRYEIKNENNQLIITKVITSQGLTWINDSNRQYPIVIDLVIDNADTAANWVSSNPTNTTVSQETTLKQEGTGSVKVQTTQNISEMDYMEYSSDANAQAAYVTSSTVDDTYTKSLLHMNGTDTSTTFTDEGGKTWTASGNHQIDTAQSVFGGASMIGDGNTAANIYTADSADFWLDGGNNANQWTVDFRARFNSTAALLGFFTQYQSSTYNTGFNHSKSSNLITFKARDNGTDVLLLQWTWSTSAVDTWYHIAVVKNGTNFYCFINGQSLGTLSDTSAMPNYTGNFEVGSYKSNTGNYGFNGWIDEFRVSKGIARWTSNFTPPTAAYSPALNVSSESTTKTQGSYSLKGIAKATNSLNQTLTRTIGSPLNLSGADSVNFGIYAGRTGSNIKVGIHDTGGTTTEVTPNISSANAWQTASLDLTGVSDANKDAIDKIIITIVNADADNTFYLDNMTYGNSSIGDTVTLTKAATDLSSINYIYFWVRSSVAGSFTRFQFGETASTEQTYATTINLANTWERKVWDISGISAGDRNAVTKFAFAFTSDTSGAVFYFDDIIQSVSPSVPTLSTTHQTDQVKTADLTPEFRFSSTDSDNDELVYEIQWDTDASFPAATSKVSDTDAGFSNITSPGDTSPFTSGNTIAHTVQSNLNNATTYFYRVRAKDPSGVNTWSSWSSIKSFTIDTSLSRLAWHETHADQFSQNTNDANITISDANNRIERISGAAYFPNWGYYRPITLPNTGSTLTDAEVLITIDTATLISNSKMQSDCDDVRIVDSDLTTVLDYWIEGGCNTDQTQIWATVPSIPNGGTTIYIYYGYGSAASAALSYSGNFTILSTASCATGWTRNADFDSSFPMGSTTYGTTGGSSTSSHTNMSCTNSGSVGTNSTAAGGSGSSATHTHSMSTTVTNATNLPPYLDMIFCESSSLTLNTDSVGIFASTPSGWTRFSSLDSTFPRGAASYSGTGGATTHTHSTTGNVSGAGVGGAERPSGSGITPANTSHTHNISNSTTSSASNIPPYLDVIYAKPNAAGAPRPSQIIMASSIPPLGWTRYSSLDDKFPQGKVTYGGSGGNSTHSHTQTLTTGGASATNSSLSGVVDEAATGSHTHSCAATSNAPTALPPYTTTIFYQRNSSEVNPSLGTEIDNSGYIASSLTPAITAANFNGNTSTTYWHQLNSNITANGSSVLFQVYYDVAGTPTLVSDALITNNSTGNSTLPISLNTLSTTAYPILYIKANLIYNAASPYVNDITVSFNDRAAMPSLDSPTNAAANQSVLPVFKTTATDSDSDYLRYKIELCTNVGMNTGCQTFDQTSSQTGWSGQNTETNTAYTSGTQATYTTQTELTPNVTYYWRSYAKDPGGLNIWSQTQATPYSFTVVAPPATPTQCINIIKDDVNTQIALQWQDVATTEDNYEIERSVDGAAFALRSTEAANTTQYLDSVTNGHTYAYRLRARLTDIESHYVYSTSYCTTITLNLQTANMGISGLKFQGLQIK